MAQTEKPGTSATVSKGTLARVAHIIDVYTVVINRGSAHGVAVGDSYALFGHGAEVMDPESGNSLGRLEIGRGRGKVTHVQEQMATIRSSTTKEVSTPNYSLILGQQQTQRVLVEFAKPQVGDYARKE